MSPNLERPSRRILLAEADDANCGFLTENLTASGTPSPRVATDRAALAEVQHGPRAD